MGRVTTVITITDNDDVGKTERTGAESWKRKSAKSYRKEEEEEEGR